MKTTTKTFKKIIFDDLKAQGLGHFCDKITSVRYKSYSMGNSLNVDSINLFKSDREKLEKFLDAYQYGEFDGMDDSYNYTGNPANKERQAKYVFLNNRFTDDIKEKVKAELKNKFEVIDDTSAMKKFSCWYDQATWRTLSDMEQA
jgi:hypothetical protein